MEEEKIKAWALPIHHVFDPTTGKHLPHCKLADELYLQIIENLTLQKYKPIFSDGTS